MRLQLYDTAGKPSSTVAVPEAITTAGRRLVVWMRRENVSNFAGLVIEGMRGEPGHRAVPREIINDGKAVFAWMAANKATKLVGLTKVLP